MARGWNLKVQTSDHRWWCPPHRKCYVYGWLLPGGGWRLQHGEDAEAERLMTPEDAAVTGGILAVIADWTDDIHAYLYGSDYPRNRDPISVRHRDRVPRQQKKLF